MAKQRSFEMDIFRRLSADERTDEAARLTALMKRYRVPARIRARWNNRISLAAVHVTGPHVAVAADSGVPWED